MEGKGKGSKAKQMLERAKNRPDWSEKKVNDIHMAVIAQALVELIDILSEKKDLSDIPKKG